MHFSVYVEKRKEKANSFTRFTPTPSYDLSLCDDYIHQEESRRTCRLRKTDDCDARYGNVRPVEGPTMVRHSTIDRSNRFGDVWPTLPLNRSGVIELSNISKIFIEDRKIWRTRQPKEKKKKKKQARTLNFTSYIITDETNGFARSRY
ncbi:uncharacterized protein LOC105422093 [Pogonomyrmex barbatus]|uniref:Uncharacterized protein LOC105422093 n=1 Tax=Pogonomyrmex barbatus TaxID=144034 RepID=A0A6I9VV90_9HYME|nr:uncharacterized protein LOC105422093 [Pogonomyrmex barbatus]